MKTDSPANPPIEPDHVANQDRARIEQLRKALRRVQQGFRNILEFRKLNSEQWGTRDGYGGRYGALTREEIEGVITEIESELQTDNRTVPDSQADPKAKQ